MLIICGSADCLWKDLARIPDDLEVDWMAVNATAIFLPKPLKYVVSLHDQHAHEYRNLRRALFSDTPQTLSDKGSPDILLPNTLPRGGSGMYAISCALQKGYQRIILAGMPIDSSRYFFDLPKIERLLSPEIRLDAVRSDAYKRRWPADAYQKTWRATSERLKPNVRSLSGFTEKLFGNPDEWLYGT